jgi:hypothetical protein
MLSFPFCLFGCVFFLCCMFLFHIFSKYKRSLRKFNLWYTNYGCKTETKFQNLDELVRKNLNLIYVIQSIVIEYTKDETLYARDASGKIWYRMDNVDSWCTIPVPRLESDFFCFIYKDEIYSFPSQIICVTMILKLEKIFAKDMCWLKWQIHEALNLSYSSPDELIWMKSIASLYIFTHQRGKRNKNKFQILANGIQVHKICVPFYITSITSDDDSIYVSSSMNHSINLYRYDSRLNTTTKLKVFQVSHARRPILMISAVLKGKLYLFFGSFCHWSNTSDLTKEWNQFTYPTFLQLQVRCKSVTFQDCIYILYPSHETIIQVDEYHKCTMRSDKKIFVQLFHAEVKGSKEKL